MEYDTVDIERRLIRHIHRRVYNYQVQDVRCSKSNLVSTRTLCRVSTWGADFRLDVSQKEITSEIRTLRDLAQYHELEGLLDVADGVLASYS